MEDFMATGLEGELLAELNLCWKYLHFTWWSDISMGDGNKISANDWRERIFWHLTDISDLGGPARI